MGLVVWWLELVWFGLAMGFWIGLIWVAVSIGLRWFKFQFMVLVCGDGLCNNGGEVVVMVSAIRSMGYNALFFFGGHDLGLNLQVME